MKCWITYDRPCHAPAHKDATTKTLIKTKKEAKSTFTSFCPLIYSKGCGLLSVILVRYGQLLAAVCTTGSQNSAAVLGGHALAETMLVHAATIVRLKCSFHFLILFIVIIRFTLSDDKSHFCGLQAAKLRIIFEITKFLRVFSLIISVFFDNLFDFWQFCSNFAPAKVT